MRIRTIKPEFFLNPELAELHPLTRIFYQGLWCAADRNGRLENKPARLKVQILPYDDHDIAEAIESLEAAGFIKQYSANGMEIIEIANFQRHQHISGREMESKVHLPGPTVDMEQTEEHDEVDSRANNIIGIWNEMAAKAGMKKATSTIDRKAARILAGIADGSQIVKAINAVASTPFLRGEGDKGWAASLIWLSKRENLDKVLSGQYANHKPPEKTKPAPLYLRQNNRQKSKYVGICDNCQAKNEVMADPKIALEHTFHECVCGKRVQVDIVMEDANAGSSSLDSVHG